MIWACGFPSILEGKLHLPIKLSLKKSNGRRSAGRTTIFGVFTQGKLFSIVLSIIQLFVYFFSKWIIISLQLTHGTPKDQLFLPKCRALIRGSKNKKSTISETRLCMSIVSEDWHFSYETEKFGVSLRSRVGTKKAQVEAEIALHWKHLLYDTIHAIELLSIDGSINEAHAKNTLQFSQEKVKETRSTTSSMELPRQQDVGTPLLSITEEKTLENPNIMHDSLELDGKGSFSILILKREGLKPETKIHKEKATSLREVLSRLRTATDGHTLHSYVHELLRQFTHVTVKSSRTLLVLTSGNARAFEETSPKLLTVANGPTENSAPVRIATIAWKAIRMTSIDCQEMQDLSTALATELSEDTSPSDKFCAALNTTIRISSPTIALDFDQPSVVRHAMDQLSSIFKKTKRHKTQTQTPSSSGIDLPKLVSDAFVCQEVSLGDISLITMAQVHSMCLIERKLEYGNVCQMHTRIKESALSSVVPKIDLIERKHGLPHERLAFQIHIGRIAISFPNGDEREIRHSSDENQPHGEYPQEGQIIDRVHLNISSASIIHTHFLCSNGISHGSSRKQVNYVQQQRGYCSFEGTWRKLDATHRQDSNTDKPRSMHLIFDDSRTQFEQKLLECELISLAFSLQYPEYKKKQLSTTAPFNVAGEQREDDSTSESSALPDDPSGDILFSSLESIEVIGPVVYIHPQTLFSLFNTGHFLQPFLLSKLKRAGEKELEISTQETSTQETGDRSERQFIGQKNTFTAHYLLRFLLRGNVHPFERIQFRLHLSSEFEGQTVEIPFRNVGVLFLLSKSNQVNLSAELLHVNIPIGETGSRCDVEQQGDHPSEYGQTSGHGSDSNGNHGDGKEFLCLTNVQVRLNGLQEPSFVSHNISMKIMQGGRSSPGNEEQLSTSVVQIAGNNRVRPTQKFVDICFVSTCFQLFPNVSIEGILDDLQCLLQLLNGMQNFIATNGLGFLSGDKDTQKGRAAEYSSIPPNMEPGEKDPRTSSLKKHPLSMHVKFKNGLALTIFEESKKASSKLPTTSTASGTTSAVPERNDTPKPGADTLFPRDNRALNANPAKMGVSPQHSKSSTSSPGMSQGVEGGSSSLGRVWPSKYTPLHSLVMQTLDVNLRHESRDPKQLLGNRFSSHFEGGCPCVDPDLHGWKSLSDLQLRIDVHGCSVFYGGQIKEVADAITDDTAILHSHTDVLEHEGSHGIYKLGTRTLVVEFPGLNADSIKSVNVGSDEELSKLKGIPNVLLFISQASVDLALRIKKPKPLHPRLRKLGCSVLVPTPSMASTSVRVRTGNGTQNSTPKDNMIETTNSMAFSEEGGQYPEGLMNLGSIQMIEALQLLDITSSGFSKTYKYINERDLPSMLTNAEVLGTTALRDSPEGSFRVSNRSPMASIRMENKQTLQAPKEYQSREAIQVENQSLEPRISSKSSVEDRGVSPSDFASHTDVVHDNAPLHHKISSKNSYWRMKCMDDPPAIYHAELKVSLCRDKPVHISIQPEVRNQLLRSISTIQSLGEHHVEKIALCTDNPAKLRQHPVNDKQYVFSLSPLRQIQLKIRGTIDAAAHSGVVCTWWSQSAYDKHTISPGGTNLISEPQMAPRIIVGTGPLHLCSVLHEAEPSPELRMKELAASVSPQRDSKTQSTGVQLKELHSHKLMISQLHMYWLKRRTQDVSTEEIRSYEIPAQYSFITQEDIEALIVNPIVSISEVEIFCRIRTELPPTILRILEEEIWSGDGLRGLLNFAPQLREYDDWRLTLLQVCSLVRYFQQYPFLSLYHSFSRSIIDMVGGAEDSSIALCLLNQPCFTEGEAANVEEHRLLTPLNDNYYLFRNQVMTREFGIHFVPVGTNESSARTQSDIWNPKITSPEDERSTTVRSTDSQSLIHASAPTVAADMNLNTTANAPESSTKSNILPVMITPPLRGLHINISVSDVSTFILVLSELRFTKKIPTGTRQHVRTAAVAKDSLQLFRDMFQEHVVTKVYIDFPGKVLDQQHATLNSGDAAYDNRQIRGSTKENADRSLSSTQGGVLGYTLHVNFYFLSTQRRVLRALNASCRRVSYYYETTSDPQKAQRASRREKAKTNENISSEMSTLYDTNMEDERPRNDTLIVEGIQMYAKELGTCMGDFQVDPHVASQLLGCTAFVDKIRPAYVWLSNIQVVHPLRMGRKVEISNLTFLPHNYWQEKVIKMIAKIYFTIRGVVENNRMRKLVKRMRERTKVIIPTVELLKINLIEITSEVPNTKLYFFMSISNFEVYFQKRFWKYDSEPENIRQLFRLFSLSYMENPLASTKHLSMRNLTVTSHSHPVYSELPEFARERSIGNIVLSERPSTSMTMPFTTDSTDFAPNGYKSRSVSSGGQSLALSVDSTTSSFLEDPAAFTIIDSRDVQAKLCRIDTSQSLDDVGHVRSMTKSMEKDQFSRGIVWKEGDKQMRITSYYYNTFHYSGVSVNIYPHLVHSIALFCEDLLFSDWMGRIINETEKERNRRSKDNPPYHREVQKHPIESVTYQVTTTIPITTESDSTQSKTGNAVPPAVLNGQSITDEMRNEQPVQDSEEVRRERSTELSQRKVSVLHDTSSPEIRVQFAEETHGFSTHGANIPPAAVEIEASEAVERQATGGKSSPSCAEVYIPSIKLEQTKEDAKKATSRKTPSPTQQPEQSSSSVAVPVSVRVAPPEKEEPEDSELTLMEGRKQMSRLFVEVDNITATLNLSSEKCEKHSASQPNYILSITNLCNEISSIGPSLRNSIIIVGDIKVIRRWIQHTGTTLYLEPSPTDTNFPGFLTAGNGGTTEISTQHWTGNIDQGTRQQLPLYSGQSFIEPVPTNLNDIPQQDIMKHKHLCKERHTILFAASRPISETMYTMPALLVKVQHETESKKPLLDPNSTQSGQFHVWQPQARGLTRTEKERLRIVHHCSILFLETIDADTWSDPFLFNYRSATRTTKRSRQFKDQYDYKLGISGDRDPFFHINLSKQYVSEFREFFSWSPDQPIGCVICNEQHAGGDFDFFLESYSQDLDTESPNPILYSGHTISLSSGSFDPYLDSTDQAPTTTTVDSLAQFPSIPTSERIYFDSNPAMVRMEYPASMQDGQRLPLRTVYRTSGGKELERSAPAMEPAPKKKNPLRKLLNKITHREKKTSAPASGAISSAPGYQEVGRTQFASEYPMESGTVFHPMTIQQHQLPIRATETTSRSIARPYDSLPDAESKTSSGLLSESRQDVSIAEAITNLSKSVKQTIQSREIHKAQVIQRQDSQSEVPESVAIQDITGPSVSTTVQPPVDSHPYSALTSRGDSQHGDSSTVASVQDSIPPSQSLAFGELEVSRDSQSVGLDSGTQRRSTEQTMIGQPRTDASPTSPSPYTQESKLAEIARSVRAKNVRGGITGELVEHGPPEGDQGSGADRKRKIVFESFRTTKVQICITLNGLGTRLDRQMITIPPWRIRPEPYTLLQLWKLLRKHIVVQVLKSAPKVLARKVAKALINRNDNESEEFYSIENNIYCDSLFHYK